MTMTAHFLATQVRANATYAIWTAGSGHPGGALSGAESLCELFVRAGRTGDPADPHRDRVILSKGNGCPSH